MKTWVNLGVWALLASAISGHAQTVNTTNTNVPAPTQYSIVQRAENQRIWQRTSWEVLPSGQTVPHMQQYTEVANGICYPGPDGQWLDSQEIINVLADGSAAATNGIFQAFFPADIYEGAMQLKSGDVSLNSQPQYLTYSDGTNYAVIAELTNSVGELISSNQLLYPGAFSGPGIDTDLMMTYRRSGVEQDVIFRTNPPAPEQFGLSSATARLQLTTAFFDVPAPQATAEPVDSQSELQDTTLTFGNIRMIQGRAFLIGNTGDPQVPIFKNWQNINANTAALVEQLPYGQVAASLATLPERVSSKKSIHSPLRKVASRWVMPSAKRTRTSTNTVKMVRIKQRPGFTLDYITINGQSLTNYVFTGDNLFFVSGPVYLYGTTVLEGGSVIKANTNGVINIMAGGTVDCQTGPYLPAMFTSDNDNAVAYGIGSGSPAMGDVHTFLNFYSTNVVLHDLHFAYALNAVNQTSAGSTGSINLWDSEFVDVATAVNAYNIGLYNVLIGRTALTNAALIVDGVGSLVGENVTADYGNEFIEATNSGTTIALTNCLVTRQPLLMTGSSVTLQTNAVVCLTNLLAPVYQICGGGNYYLTNSSPYATAGTPNIDPDLLADLQQKTVWPPTVYADTNISSLGTLSPSVPRDTNAYPAIGFHFDPLDAVFGGADLYSNLIVTAGTAIGWFEENGGVSTSGQPYSMTLNHGANLVFNGTATQPCYWSQYAMVQERGNNNWNGAGYMGSFTFNGSGSNPEPLLTANFTKFTVGNLVIVVRDNSGPGAGIFKNCELYNATIGTYDLSSLTFTNCLFFRDCMDFWAGDAIDFTNDNCTYYDGGLALSRTTNDSASFWSIENTIFDGTLLCFYDPYNGSSAYTSFNYNAYNTNNLSWQTYYFPYSNWLITNILENPGPNEVMTNNFAWESSSFGDFYLPSNSSVNRMGSTNANFLGLYHFTTQTNQTPEGTNRVTIGYAYVATDTNGLPLDSNGDGIPDYLEDRNGDGLVDNGETNWALAILTQPVSQIAVPGTNANFYVGADGVAPLSYQWYFNGTYLPWATNSTLTITNAQSVDEGLYFAVVSNFSGSLTSSVVALEPSGLIGWWPGESNALDNAGPNDGEPMEGTSFTNGVIGQAFQFDGTNGYVLIPDSPILKPTNLTIEAWVRFSSLASYVYEPADGPPDVQFIVEKPNINPTSRSYFNDEFYTHGFVLFKQLGADGINDNFEFGVAASDGMTEVFATNSILSIQTNVWYFLAGVRGSNYIQLYVNGQLADQEDVDFDQSYGAAPLYLGSSGQPAMFDSRIEGDLDEVALYDRALSSNEIQETYSAGRSGIRNCQVPPVIVTQPSSQYATEGTTATLLVAAAGSPPLSYQWSFDGTNIAGATNSTLILPGVQSTNTGNYSVVVSNPQGTVTSSDALLAVDTCFPSVDVTLVIDDSCYTTNLLSDGNMEISAAQVAATNLVRALNFTNDQAALFSFNDNVATNQTLTNSAQDLLNAIGSLIPPGFTFPFMGNALQISQSESASPRHNPYAQPVMVFLTGEQPVDINFGNDPSVDNFGADYVDTTNLVLEAATLVKAAGTRLITVALGTNADTNLMTLMATSPNDAYYATNCSQLTNDFNLIADSICRGTNSLPIPGIEILSPINQTNLARQTVTVTAMNLTTNVPISWVEFFDDNTNIIGFAPSNNSYLYNVDWLPVTGGVHVLTAMAMGSDGVSSWSAPVTNYVRNLPTISITNPVYGELFQNPPTNIEIYATANSSADLGATNLEVIFYLGTNSIGTNYLAPYTNFWTFTNAGTDTLSAVVIDSQRAIGITSNIMITIEPTNQGPFVYAGPNQTNNWSTNGVPLNGRVSDDGLPLGSVLSVNWTNLSGNSVNFENSNLPVTTAYFAGPGTNVLQLSAWDGPITNHSDVTIVVLPTNPPPVVFAGPWQTNVLPAVSSNVFGTVSEFQINGNIPKATGIDYFPASNEVVASVNYNLSSGGIPFNFELVDSNGNATQFSSISNLNNEVYIAAVRDTMGGFKVGEIFTGNGVGGDIMRIEPDGSTIGNVVWTNTADGSNYANAWLTLSNSEIGSEQGLLRGGLWVDRTGVWGGDLIVAAETGDFGVPKNGDIWRVNSSGKATLVARISGSDSFEGITTIPNDPEKYGPWAGCIMAGGDTAGDLFAINTNGFVVQYSFPFGAEDIRVIPQNENLFGCDQDTAIWGVPANQFSGMVGDILIADETSEELYRLQWNGQQFEIYPILSNPTHEWEGINFAPAGVQNMPTAPWVQLAGVVTDSVPTINNWTVISNSSGAEVEFSDPSLTNSTVNFTGPGTYVLQLSASNDEFTVTSNVTIIVYQNQAPWVFAGTNQSIATGQADLDGLVTNITLPPPYNTNNIVWTVASEPSGATATFDWTERTTNANYFVVTNAVNLPSPGVYVLCLTADDGQATNSAYVTIYCQAPTNIIAPAFVFTPTNETANVTVQLVNATNGPITNSFVYYTIRDAFNANASSGYLLTNNTNGWAALAYTNNANPIEPDTIEFSPSNSDGVVVYETNNWGYPMTCGDQWLGRHMASDFSVEPWPDGYHYADYYIFNDNAGDTIHLGLVNEHGEPHVLDNSPPLMMFLRNSNQVVAVSQPTQDANFNGNAGTTVYGTTLEFTNPATGRYVLEVAATQPLSEGVYDLYVSCGDETTPNMQVLFDGTNVPTGSTITFPTISVGSSTNISLTITNSGNEQFTIVGLGTNTTFALTNTILGDTIAAQGSTNAGILFDATSSGTTMGSLVLSASYPAGSNYIVYFMANTVPTDSPPEVQITWPPNGSTFISGAGMEIPFTVIAAPGSCGIRTAPAVYLDFVTTNGLVDHNNQQLSEIDSLPVWTNSFLSGYSPWSGSNLTVTAVATDVCGNTNYATPIVINILPYYSANPNQSPDIQLLYNGANVPSGGTVNFPLTTPGTPVTVSLVVTNDGNYPLGIPGIELAGDFTLTNDLQGQTFVGGTATNLEITFNASANGSGVGELVLTNNASPGGVYVVNLVGNAFPQGYVPPSGIPPVATNEQITVLANSVNNTIYPLYLDRQFDTNVLTITSVDTSQGTAGRVTIINNGTAINYRPPPGFRSEEIGGVLWPADGFYYTISDANGNTATGLIKIIIYATDGPDVTLGVSPTSSPNAGDTETLTATINNTPPTNIAYVAFYVNNQEVGSVPGSNAIGGTIYVTNWSALYEPQYPNDIVVAAATDIFGQVGVSQPTNLDVQVPTNATPPVAGLTSYEGLSDTTAQTLTTNVTIREGVFNVYGQAYHPKGSNIVWQLSLYSADGTTLIRNLTPTNTVPVGSATTTGVLALCDLSTVQNGPYQLVLTITGDYIEEISSVPFFLDSNLKIGQFSFSQQDIALPVAGIPLTVTRTYNSINPIKGDFGYGWTYALANMNVSLDETRQNRMDLDGDVFSERTGGGYDVTLTLPGGQVTTFAFNYDGPTALGGYLPTWKPAPGVTATLTLQSADQDDVLQTIETGLTGGTIPPFWSRDPDTPWQSFDFSGFVLKTVDGTQYYINRQDLGEHTLLDGGEGADVEAYGDCFLAYIKERNGDLITINSNSIVFTATNGASKEIAITRNPDNLITSISDPNGINTPGNPPSLVYQYDNQDNLIAVEQLVNATNSTYVTNTFSYTNSVFPHYITGIINANGTQVAKNFYDDSGKLIAVQDANGNLTQFFNTPSNSMEVVIDRLGNTNSYVYDSRGNVIQETNALGQITTMGYDVNNNKTNEIMYLNGAPYSTNSYFYDTNLNVMLSSTDPLGHKNTYQYDTNAELLVSTDARSYSTTNTYDANGNMISTSDALGNTTTNIYNGDLLNASIDPIGTMTTNTYDPNDNLTASATVGASGILSSNTFTYDDNGNRRSSTVWRRLANGSWEGDTTSNIYDAMNRVVQTINPDGGSSSSIYTSTGQQQSTTDANTNTTSYGYDDENRLIVTTNADGTTTISTYDNDGNRITSTDQEGRVTQYQYDGLNRLTNTIYPDDTTSATIYDTLGRVAQTIDARGTIIANGYDVAGRRIAVTNAVGSSCCSTNYYSYDQNGNQITFMDADGNTTTNIYDALNRQVQVQYQNGTASETVYDADGRSIAQTNQDGVATFFGYDGSGRLISVTNALRQVTKYQYDEAGNELAQIDALNRTNTFAYDGMGRKVLHTLPGLSAGQSHQSEGWAYDLNGNQIAHTNFAWPVDTVYSMYDEMNRLTNRSDGGYNFDEYTYTPTGQRASMLDNVNVPSGGAIISNNYYYDSRDRLKQKTINWNNNQFSESLTYGYDANGNVTNIDSEFANGVHLAYAYDALSRLTNVLAQAQEAAGYSYDLAGNLTGMRYGNGVTNRYQYDSLNRLTNLVWNYHSSPRASYAYQLMNGGTRTNLLESTNGSPVFTYEWSFDNLYRLTNELMNPSVGSPGSVFYAYDSVGNRTNQVSTISGVSSDNYSYDTNDEVLSDTNNNNPSYNPDGDMYQWGNYQWYPAYVHGGDYDYLDRMTYASDASDACRYYYDGDNNLVERQVDGGNLVFEVVDDLNPSGYSQVLEEFTQASSSAVLTRVYNYGSSLISQQQFDPNSYLPSTISYYGYDGHGSVRFLTDTNGSITDTYTYDAFGNLIYSTGSMTNDYLYCGLQYDWVSGLYNNRARRMFSPLGIFTTRDGDFGNNEDPLSLHKYLYGADDPVDNEDPSGNDFTTVETLTAVDIGVSIGVSALVTYNAAELLIGAHNYAAISAVGQQLKIPVMQSPPEDDNQYKYFVHGTSTGAWGNSTRIDPELGFRKDFGRGFYTFPCNPLGLYWAADRTRGLSGVPFLLVERISNSDYGALSKLDFNDPGVRPAWGTFVNECRAGKRQGANRDLVIGPISMYDHASEQWVQDPDITIDQYKFEAGGVAKLQLFCILPAITQLEAGF